MSEECKRDVMAFLDYSVENAESVMQDLVLERQEDLRLHENHIFATTMDDHQVRLLTATFLSLNTNVMILDNIRTTTGWVFDHDVSAMKIRQQKVRQLLNETGEILDRICTDSDQISRIMNDILSGGVDELPVSGVEEEDDEKDIPVKKKICLDVC